MTLFPKAQLQVYLQNRCYFQFAVSKIQSAFQNKSLLNSCIYTELCAGREKDIITEAVDCAANVQRSKSKLKLIFRLNWTTWGHLVSDDQTANRNVFHMSVKLVTPTVVRSIGYLLCLVLFFFYYYSQCPNGIPAKQEACFPSVQLSWTDKGSVVSVGGRQRLGKIHRATAKHMVWLWLWPRIDGWAHRWHTCPTGAVFGWVFSGAKPIYECKQRVWTYVKLIAAQCTVMDSLLVDPVEWVYC